MHVPERIVWSYAVQLASALKRIHDEGLAARVVDASKILVTGRNRSVERPFRFPRHSSALLTCSTFPCSLRLNCCALLDVVTHGSGPSVTVHQQEDILALGKLLLGLTNISTQAIQNLPKALDVLSRSYSEELKNFVLFLLSNPPPGMGKTIEDVLALLGPHVLADLNAAHDYNDLLESDMTKELENGRLVRLLTKFGFINERPECVSRRRRPLRGVLDLALTVNFFHFSRFDHDPRWSESGDRYIIKLFRDMVFHQVDESNQPVLDLSHVLTCLNKVRPLVIAVSNGSSLLTSQPFPPPARRRVGREDHAHVAGRAELSGRLVPRSADVHRGRLQRPRPGLVIFMISY